VSTVVVIAPLRQGAHDAVRVLVASGPPFDLDETRLASHHVYLTEHEAVFVFDGPEARQEVERLLGERAVWSTAGTWRDWLSDRPRIAGEAFAWSRE
jgi:hypothetical protein